MRWPEKDGRGGCSSLLLCRFRRNWEARETDRSWNSQRIENSGVRDECYCRLTYSYLTGGLKIRLARCGQLKQLMPQPGCGSYDSRDFN